MHLFFNAGFQVKTRIKKYLYVQKTFITDEVKFKNNLNYRLFYKNPTKYGNRYRNVRNTVTKNIRTTRDEYYKNKLQNKPVTAKVLGKY